MLSGSFTLRPETGTWSIGFLLWTVTFLRLASCLQAGELLVKLAAHARSSYTLEAHDYDYTNIRVALQRSSGGLNPRWAEVEG